MAARKPEMNLDGMPTVLIISQDMEMVNVWETLFEQKNCHVVSETSAGDALQASRLLAPALIVLDLSLSQPERVDLCRELRETSQGTLLLLAPKGNMAEISEYLYAGADEFLSTPVSPVALLIKSMAWLARQEWDTLKAGSSQAYR